MALVPFITGVQIVATTFPATVKPPGSDNSLFLGGTGLRGSEVNGYFLKLAAIGVYLEDKALPVLAVKWKGKTAMELMESVEFFREIVTGKVVKDFNILLH